MKTLEITVKIKDENGNQIIENTSESSIPYIEEIEEIGFRAAFHDLENTVLDVRKEVCERTVSEYLEITSKKKPKKNYLSEKQ